MKQIHISTGKYYDCCQKKRNGKELIVRFSDEAYVEPDERKAQAVDEWSDRLCTFDYQMIYNPSFECKNVEYKADLYLIDSDMFMLIRDCVEANVAAIYEKAVTIATASERNVVVGNYDGRFAVLDYKFHEEEQIITGNNFIKPFALESKGYSANCPECGSSAFVAASGYRGCRTCGKRGGGMFSALRFDFDSRTKFTEVKENGDN
jgi:hypothetical protein